MSEPNSKLSYHTTSTRISASAGTGKTYQLASRYIALLMLGADPEKIIALTFTKKAAGEFRSRILHALAEGACDVRDKTGRNVMTARVWEAWSGYAQNDEKAAVRSANSVPLLPATSAVVKRAGAEGLYAEDLYAQDAELRDYLLLPEANAATFSLLLANMVKVLSKLSLSTLDSFFNTLVTGSSMELGVSSVTAQDPTDEAPIRRATVDDYLEERTKDAEKRKEFLQMFAGLTNGASNKTVSHLEKNLKDFLSLYRAYPAVEPWRNDAYFAQNCRGVFVALTPEEAAAWKNKAAELGEMLALFTEIDFPQWVYSGLQRLIRQDAPLSKALIKWLDKTDAYRNHGRLTESARRVMTAFDAGSPISVNEAELSAWAEGSFWTSGNIKAFQSVVAKMTSGKAMKSTKAIDSFREFIRQESVCSQQRLDALATIQQTAKELADALPKKCLYDAKCRTADLYSLLHDYAVAYEKRIENTGEFSFDDIARSARLLMERMTQGDDAKEASYYCREHLALRTGRKYQHWMLDEFQDTSDDQFATLAPVLEGLATDAQEGRIEFTPDAPRPLPSSLLPYHEDSAYSVTDGSIFVVGDEKQSIYGFRTGETQAFSALETQEPWKGAIENAELCKSFRSSPVLMGPDGFINTIFRQLQEVENEDKKEEADEEDKLPAYAVDLSGYTHHDTAKPYAGYVEIKVVNSVFDDEDESAAAEENRTDLKQEAYYEVSQVLKRLTVDDRTPINNMSIAVLTRSNQDADNVVEYLHTAMPELPVLLVKDSLAAAAAPLGELLLHFFRWLLHPQQAFSAAAVQASFIGNIFTPGMSERAAWCECRQYLDDNGYTALLKRIFAELTPELRAENQSVIITWLNAARTFETAGGTLAAWVQHVSTLSVQGVGSSRYVQVMTMHKSKGLEFDAVILPILKADAVDALSHLTHFSAPDGSALLLPPAKPDAWETYWPGAFTELTHQWQKNRSQEDYNLLYVALTRAKRANYILLHGKGIEDERGKQLSAARSVAGLIRRALHGPMGKALETYTLETYGDSEWYKALKAADAEQTELDTFCTLGKSVALRRKVSPSRLLSAAQEEEKKTWKYPVSFSRPDGRSALEFGTAVHNLFEQIEWLPADGSLPLDETDSDEARLVCQALRVPEIAAVFRETAGSVVYNEQNIDALWPVNGEETWTSGTIDRLVLTYEGDKVVSAKVYDYKTNIRQGKTAQEQDANLREHYQGQMSAYHALICAAFGLPADRVEVALISCPSDHSPARLVPCHAES